MHIAHPTIAGLTREVPDADAASWLAAGWLGPVETFHDHELLETSHVTFDPPVEYAYPDGDPHTTWTVAELRAYATDHDIDLAGARGRLPILAAIRAVTDGATGA